MGTSQERRRILVALREWADSQPDQNAPIFFYRDRYAAYAGRDNNPH